MGKQICEVCEYIYDDEKSGTAWENLPDNWICPVCASSKKLFKKIEEGSIVPEPELQKEMKEDEPVMDLNRTMSDTESYLSDIHGISRTGKCPVGIATQDPDLRRRFNVDQASKQLENYLSVSTEELKIFARLTGNNKLNGLGIDDLCTTNSEISGHTTILHV